jgi:hypothetical protein
VPVGRSGGFDIKNLILRGAKPIGFEIFKRINKNNFKKKHENMKTI